jgi:hypothetical protein
MLTPTAKAGDPTHYELFDRRISLPRILITAAALAASTLAAAAPAVAAPGTTAWQNGHFVVDTPNVVCRANIVLGKPKTAPAQSVPLGNGTLGAAVWAANGFTAQLNRTGTFPDRKSPGQVVIPGLSRLTGAADFSGYLEPVRRHAVRDRRRHDIDRVGPRGHRAARRRRHRRGPEQHADRAGQAVDRTVTVGTGFRAGGDAGGDLAGQHGDRRVRPDFRHTCRGDRRCARGCVLHAELFDGAVSFQPNADGSFRVIVAASAWTGGDAIATANSVVNGDATKPAATIAAPHLSWWHDFWSRPG